MGAVLARGGDWTSARTSRDPPDFLHRVEEDPQERGTAALVEIQLERDLPSDPSSSIRDRLHVAGQVVGCVTQVSGGFDAVRRFCSGRQQLGLITSEYGLVEGLVRHVGQRYVKRGELRRRFRADEHHPDR